MISEEFRQVTKEEFLSDKFSELLCDILPADALSVQTYLDAFHPEVSEIYIGLESLIFTRKGKFPTIAIMTRREWTKDEVQKLIDNFKPESETSIKFQGPDCEAVQWMKSQNSYATIDVSVLSLTPDVWENLEGNLRRQVRKAQPKLRSLEIENYTPEIWRMDLASLTKFIIINEIVIRDLVVLPELYAGLTQPDHIKRVRISTEAGDISGIVSQWKDTWTADYHWSFNRYKSKEINLTTLFHWLMIEEAKKNGIKYYNLGRIFKKNPGLLQYKAQWNADVLTTSIIKVNS